MVEITCAVCKETFTRQRSRAGFCSKACSMKGRPVGDKTCAGCGKASPEVPFRSPGYSKCRKCSAAQLVCSARSRSLALDLTVQDYGFLIEAASCTYCGGCLSPYGYNLDRIDSSKGYLRGNVVVCCGRCNSIKLDHLSHAEMLEVGKLLADIDRRRREKAAA